jgi:hypothetical protein
MRIGITGWFTDLRGWVINESATMIAAAVADEDSYRQLRWRVLILPIGSPHNLPPG